MDRRSLLRFAVLAPVIGFAGWPSDRALAEAASAAPARKPLPPEQALSRLIVIDPGHGGHDPGAIGARGTMEKDVTLDIAKEMARSLKRQTGISAVLTREDDSFLTLKERVEIARTAKAGLFISVHADSAPNAQARGLSAYTLSDKATDDFAAAIARQENLGDALGIDMSHMDAAVQAFLVDLAADHTKRAALSAKQALVQAAGRELRLLDNPMRSANFAVLKAPDVPSVLVETGFLSNREDEKLLRDAGQRRKVAGLLARELAAVIRAAPFA